MQSQTMQLLRELLIDIFNRPMMTGEVVRLQLETIAVENPRHPMPLLTKAVVLGMGRRDVGKMKEYLAQAEPLFDVEKCGPAPAPAPIQIWHAARQLHAALSAETILVECRSILGRPDPPENVSVREQAASKLHEALAQLEQCSHEGEDMAIFRIMVGALGSLSLANEPNGPRALARMAMLERIRGEHRPLSPLASYYLIFAYRRAGKDDDAIRVASTLLEHHPQSIISRLTLASTFAANHEYLKAAALVREVSVLVPDDPWLYLGRAALLRRAKSYDKARTVLARVRVPPNNKELQTLLDVENQLIRLQSGREDTPGGGGSRHGDCEGSKSTRVLD